MNSKVSVVITDLDNTLFDWVRFWYLSFKSFFDFLVAESGISSEVLEKELRRVFQEHGTSEYLLSFDEIPSFRKYLTRDNFAQAYENAACLYRQQRKEIVLYPTVRETLEALKQKRCLVVIFTESQKRYTLMRLRLLRIDHLVDYVFSPADIAGIVSSDGAYRQTRLFEEPAPAPFRYYAIRKDERKPNPAALLKILKKVGITRQQSIYIGDHLMKDIHMAQSAGVTDVHARYGQAQFSEAYHLLRKVSYWTDEEIAREQAIYSQAQSIQPSHVLHSSFGEICDLFEFSPYISNV